MAKVSVRWWMPATVVLDGETIRGEVKRLARDEFIAFEREWKIYGRPDPATADLVAEHGGDASKMAEAIEARERELPESERTARQRAREVRQIAMIVWIDEVVRSYWRVPEGEVEVDGEPVTSGDQFVTVFSAEIGTMLSIVAQVWYANVLTSAQRKNFGSLFDSSTTSEERPQALDGPRPAPIVAGAAPPDSVPIADATSPTTETTLVRSSGATG